MRSDPVLFLDIDGVLLPGDLAAPPADRELPWSHLLPSGTRSIATVCCPRAIASLNDVLCRTGARVVLISTWRRALGAAETATILGMQGVMDAWHPHVAAPWTGDKATDVAAWLADHPEVTRWAVIDDERLWRPGHGYWHRQVTTDARAGPQAAHWRRLEAALSR